MIYYFFIFYFFFLKMNIDNDMKWIG